MLSDLCGEFNPIISNTLALSLIAGDSLKFPSDVQNFVINAAEAQIVELLRSEDSSPTVLGSTLNDLDMFFTIAFAVELALNMFSHWLHPFLRDGPVPPIVVPWRVPGLLASPLVRKREDCSHKCVGTRASERARWIRGIDRQIDKHLAS